MKNAYAVVCHRERYNTACSRRAAEAAVSLLTYSNQLQYEMKTYRVLFGKLLFWLGITLAGGFAVMVLVAGDGLVILLGVTHYNPFTLLSIFILTGLGLATMGLWQLYTIESERQWKKILLSIPIFLLAFLFLGKYYVFPSYHQKIITFSNEDVTLSGSLLIPTKGEPPYPAVVLIAGCCNNFTDESRWGSYATARLFLEHGIATLIYDKRGFGGSTGAPSAEASFEELAEDTLAGFNQLLIHEEINPNKVGLWGISNGSWVAPFVASKTDKVAFLILTSGGVVSPSEEFEFEIRLALEEANYTSQEIEQVWPEISRLRNQINAYYRSNEQYDAVIATLQSVQNESWFLTVHEAGAFPGPEELCNYGSRCAESHIANWDFDTIPLIKDLDIPVLFFFGPNDTIFPAVKSIERIRAEHLTSSEQDVELVIIPGAGHSMLESWPIMTSICYCRPMSLQANSFFDLATGFIPRFIPEYKTRMTAWVLRRLKNEGDCY